MLFNALWATLGLIIAGILAAMGFTWGLVPLLRPLADVADPSRGLPLIAGSIVIVMATGAICGGLFTLNRRAVTWLDAIVASILFLGVEVISATVGRAHWSQASVSLAVASALLTLVSFWFPSVVLIRRAGRAGRWVVPGHLAVVAGAVALLGWLIWSTGPGRVVHLDARGQSFVDSGRIAEAMANGAAAEEPARHAERAAVADAAARLRAAPCDADARAALRQALVHLIDAHAEDWFRPDSEAVILDGHPISMTRRLDEPALAEFWRARAAGVVTTGDLTKTAQDRLMPGGKAAEAGAFACERH